jgi:hypothetical protein
MIAQGLRKQTIVKKQSGLGVPAIGAGGQVLRRETSNFTKTKATYESEEIATHQQSTGARHGLQATTGKVNGLLSPATYQLFMASALRKDFAAGASTGALTNVTAAVVTGASGTFTRAAGSFLTDGFKVGDVVRWSGWTTTGVPNNAHNFLITILTATVMTGVMIDGVAVGAKASGDSVTGAVVGKKTLAPLTGHTNDYFTFEEWYADVEESELYPDMKLNQVSLDLPASGNCKVSFDFIGLRRTLDSAQQLTTPASETLTDVLAAVSGEVIVDGIPLGTLTGLQLTVAEGVTASGPVIGSDFSPDLSAGRIKVSGSFSAYFEDRVLMDIFDDETAIAILIVVAASNDPAADFIAFTLGRVKLSGDAPDDGEKGIVRAYPFTAEINRNGGAALAYDQTIMSIQDSAVV